MVREFSFLVSPARDVAGQWVAHCLNWDVVSQGDSPSHAISMLVEAVEMVIEADDEDDFDSELRPAAPEECWTVFSRIQHHGKRMSPTMPLELPEAPALAYALTFYRREQNKVADLGEVSEYTPPPFVVQALQQNNEANC
jgi:predicted RNase H-like HicB family nuclease